MINQITYEELLAWQSECRDFLLVDVRESWEREAHSIGGEHIPLGEVVGRVDLLTLGKPVVFYCRKGVRSQIAIQRLAMRGEIASCYNLFGGIG